MVEYHVKQAWTLAIETMSWIDQKNTNTQTALERATRLLGIDDDRVVASANRLVRETLNRRNFIDKIIENSLAPAAPTLDRLNLRVLSFLRLFTYQTKFSEDGETQGLDLANLGRAVLGWQTIKPAEETLGRILAAKMSTILDKVEESERISFETFHPKWFVDYCIKVFGKEETLKLLRKNLEPPPTYVRLNTLKEKEEEILSQFSASGVVLEKVENIRFLYKIVRKRMPLVKLKAYSDGLFFIEDKSSCIPVEVGDPQPGSVVLDVCAAPGTKTTHIAQLMQNRGDIISIDYSPNRTRVLKQELCRSGVGISDIIVCDARIPLPVNFEADLVLLDPPCSGTGAFWRMPTSKWRTDIMTVRNIADVQRLILKSSAEHVKKGGKLVYSTTSITLEENEMVIDRFLKEHLEFSLEITEPRIGAPALNQRGSQRTYTHIHEANGSYTAKLFRD
ncbi:MAG: rRNA (cytosine967-C5)-methyltransferase [Thermoproteota archaeon]|nr:rRNA (cytosine967-C5)-methyltransferase [Thermoproteota archaeon]